MPSVNKKVNKRIRLNEKIISQTIIRILLKQVKWTYISFFGLDLFKNEQMNC
jgi:hypothetical protein